MMLKDKVAVIYGAGGAIGGAVARGFAAEGARVFLTGRHRAPVEAVAKDIVSADGSAEVAEVDVLDEQAVDRYLRYVVGQAGRIDVALRPNGMAETSTMRELFEIRARASGMTWEQFEGYLASMTHPRRVMTLEETANVAAFMASDKASGMTGTTVNLTMGTLDD
jgi:NAD(P)-dependent dehydrogenase (short-subunit alcohol dehydrogenase family)